MVSHATIGNLVKKTVSTVSKLLSDKLTGWIRTNQADTWLCMEHIAEEWSKDLGVEISSKQIGNCLLDLKRLEVVVGRDKLDKIFNLSLATDFLSDKTSIDLEMDKDTVGGPAKNDE